MTMKGKGCAPLRFQLHDNETLVQCPYNPSHHVTNFRMMTHLLRCRRNHAKDMEMKGEEVTMMVCKYNWTHQVASPEILYHELNCSDQYNVIPHILEYFEPADDDNKSGKTNKKYELYLTRGGTNENDPATKVGVMPVSSSGPGPSRNPGGSSRNPGGPVAASGNWVHRAGGPVRVDNEEDWEADCRRHEYRSYDPSAKLEAELVLKFPPSLTKSERRAYRLANHEKTHRLFSGTNFDQTPRNSVASERSSGDMRPSVAGSVMSEVNSYFRAREMTPSMSTTQSERGDMEDEEDFSNVSEAGTNDTSKTTDPNSRFARNLQAGLDEGRRQEEQELAALARSFNKRCGTDTLKRQYDNSSDEEVLDLNDWDSLLPNDDF